MSSSVDFGDIKNSTAEEQVVVACRDGTSVFSILIALYPTILMRQTI